MTDIPLDSGILPFYPKASAETHPDVAFLIRIPTWADRDNAGLIMYRMGVREIRPEQIRAAMLHALWDVFGDDEADDNARFLEGFWQQQTQYQSDMALWAVQESIRLEEDKELGAVSAAEPAPKDPTSARDRARAAFLTHEVTNLSEMVRDKLADQQDYEKRFRLVGGRLRIAGWLGLETEAMFDKKFNALTECTIEALRTELAQKGLTGAWEEAITHAIDMFEVDMVTEKNSASPLETSSTTDVSIPSDTGSEPVQDGESTASATVSAPSSE